MFSITLILLFKGTLFSVFIYFCARPLLGFIQQLRISEILGLGHLLKDYQNLRQHRFLEASRERFIRDGHTYIIKTMDARAIFTIDPDNIRTLLAANFDHYSVGRRRGDAFVPYLGHSIISADGGTWASSRHLLRSSFTLRQADLTIYERHIGHLLQAIPVNGTAIDLQPLFFHLAMDIASEFFLGASTDCLRPENLKSSSAEFSERFSRLQCAIRNRLCLGKFTNFALPVVLDSNRRYIRKFVDNFIQTAILARRHRDSENFDGVEKRNFLIDKLAHSPKDASEIREDVLHLFLGARDTTGSLLSNLWFVLARRPDIWAKLQQEVVALGPGRPTLEKLKGMKYMQSCIKESLRLHPPIPFNGRTSICDTVLPRGGGQDGKSPLLVPSGTIVDYNVYTLHRREDIYGHDFNQFKPERWDSLRVGWEYLPFSGGPRLCLGHQLAVTEVAYTTVRMLQEFKSVERKDSEPWREALTLTCASANGTKVVFTPHDSASLYDSQIGSEREQFNSL